MSEMLNVFDLSTRKKSAVLQNAFDVYETKEMNKIYSLTFSIPKTDDKLKYCLPRHYIRWGENNELYRIIKPTRNENDMSYVTFECEHVIATLCDKCMFGSFTVGGWEMKTAAVIRWLLSQQVVRNWELGECDFDRRFEYLWEQENILNALYSIPKEFSTPYQWTFDTTVYPWRLNLKVIDDSVHPEYYLRAKRNLLSSGTTENYADICTRIYPLGYGEGVNQLGIKEINNGVPYLQSPDEIVAQYGIVEKVLVDRRFENAESLKAYAQTMLDNLQTPAMSRSFDVVDLYPLTKDNIDNAEVGKIVKMVEDDSIAYITKTRRKLDGDGDLSIDISTKTSDIASTIADLADRVRIESVYAQGATQLYQHSKDANATPEKGMTISLYFPEEMRQINKVLLKMSLKQFRSYSDTTEDAGGSTPTTSDGGGTQSTTSSGGGTSSTTSAGGATGTTSTGSSTISASAISGSSSIETTESGGFGSDIVTSKTKINLQTSSVPVTVQGIARDSSGLLPNTGSKILETSEVELTSGYGGGGQTEEKEVRTKTLTGLTTNAVELVTDGNEGGSTSEVELTTGGANLSIEGSTDNASISITGHSTTAPVNASGASNYNTSSADVSITVSGSTDNSTPSHGCNSSGEHNHNVWCNTGEVTPPASANYRHSHAINYTGAALSNGSHSHSITGGSHSHWFSKTASGSHSHQYLHYHSLNISSCGSHSHTFSLYGVGSHSHGVGKHSHTIGAHSHSIAEHSHTVTNHGHTVMAHSHEMPEHYHTISKHKHSIDAHYHSMGDHTHTTINHSHFTNDENGHSHTIDKSKFRHTHGMEHTHTINLSGVGSHSHSFSISAHTHEVNIPDHSHSVNIPNHSHTVEIPAHSHQIIPGIFESGNPSAFDIYVNNTKITTVYETYYEDDITTWLLNDERQIPRNTWIDVEIRPNDLAYVVSSVFVQGFVQSRGGGNY